MALRDTWWDERGKTIGVSHDRRTVIQEIDEYTARLRAEADVLQRRVFDLETELAYSHEQNRQIREDQEVERAQRLRDYANLEVELRDDLARREEWWETRLSNMDSDAHFRSHLATMHEKAMEEIFRSREKLALQQEDLKRNVQQDNAELVSSKEQLVQVRQQLLQEMQQAKSELETIEAELSGQMARREAWWEDRLNSTIANADMRAQLLHQSELDELTRKLKVEQDELRSMAVEIQETSQQLMMELAGCRDENRRLQDTNEHQREVFRKEFEKMELELRSELQRNEHWWDSKYETYVRESEAKSRLSSEHAVLNTERDLLASKEEILRLQAEFEAERQTLKREITAMEMKVGEEAKRNTELWEAKLAAIVAQKNDEVQSSRQDVLRMQHMLEEEQTQSRNLVEMKRKYQQQLKSYQDNSGNEVAQWQQQYMMLENARQHDQREVETTRKEVTDLVNKNTELSGKLASLNQENDALRSQITELQKSNAQLRKGLRRVEGGLDRSRQRLMTVARASEAAQSNLRSEFLSTSKLFAGRRSNYATTGDSLDEQITLFERAVEDRDEQDETYLNAITVHIESLHRQIEKQLRNTETLSGMLREIATEHTQLHSELEENKAFNAEMITELTRIKEEAVTTGKQNKQLLAKAIANSVDLEKADLVLVDLRHQVQLLHEDAQTSHKLLAELSEELANLQQISDVGNSPVDANGLNDAFANGAMLYRYQVDIANHLDNELATAQYEYDSLQQRFEATEEARQQSIAALEQANYQLSVESKETHQKAILEMAENHRNAIAEIDERNRKMLTDLEDSHRRTVDELTESKTRIVNDLREQLDRSHAEHREANQKLAEANKSILETQTENLRAQLEEARASHRRDLEQHQTQLGFASDNVAERTRVIAELEANNRTHLAEIQSLKQSNADMQIQIAGYEQKIEELTKDRNNLIKLQAEYSGLGDRQEILEKDLQARINQLAQKDDKIAELEEQLEENSVKMENLKEMVRKCQVVADTSTAEAHRLQEQVDATNKQLATQRGEEFRRALDDRLLSIKRSAMEATKQSSEYSEVCIELKKQVSNQEQMLNTMETKHRDEIRASQQQLTSLSAKCNELLVIRDKLQKQLSDSEASLLHEKRRSESLSESALKAMRESEEMKGLYDKQESELRLIKAKVEEPSESKEKAAKLKAQSQILQQKLKGVGSGSPALSAQAGRRASVMMSGGSPFDLNAPLVLNTPPLQPSVPSSPSPVGK